MKIFKITLVALSILVLSACSNEAFDEHMISKAPEIKSETASGKLLRSLPQARKKAVVAVYEFADQTGQHKPSDNFAEFSRAVTQGGMAILSESLTKAGNGNWFRVIERSGLDNLLRERQIIAATREQYTNSKTPLPPMLFAGLLLEGGIISFETNTVTGGFGARYLGIGGNTQYRQDIVTIYLRAINVQNGEVVLSTNASKTIFSSALSGSAFKFVAFDELLEIESGFTLNEPPQFAVRQAIESGVYSLIMEGVLKGVWEFDNPAQGRVALRKYLELRDGEVPSEYEPVHSRPAPMPATPAMQSPVTTMPAPNATVAAPAPVMQKPVAPVQAALAYTQEDFEALRQEDTAPMAFPHYDEQPAETPSAPVEQLDPAAQPLRSLPLDNGKPVLMNQRREAEQYREAKPLRSYQRIQTSDDEELFCDSKGCYPFEPPR